MKGYTLALVPALLLGTSAFAAGENINAQNRNFQVLQQVIGMVPGSQNHQIIQQSDTFQIQNASDQRFNGTSLETAVQEVQGGKIIASKSYGETRNNQGETFYWTVTQANGQIQNQGQPNQITNISGQFEWRGGTGPFQNLKGGGQFSCELGSGQNGCNWQANAENMSR